MKNKEDFQSVFNRLKTILVSFEPNLVVTSNEVGHYSLNTPFIKKYGKEVFFGAVIIKKNYVSYHLMPVYVFPELLDGLSPVLRKRMQGKSCFNFTTLNNEILEELSELTDRCFSRFQQEGQAGSGAR
jgi:hypothetical protein